MHIWEKEQITTRELLASGWNVFRQHVVFFMAVGFVFQVMYALDFREVFPNNDFACGLLWYIDTMIFFMMPYVIYNMLIEESTSLWSLGKCFRRFWFQIFIMTFILNCFMRLTVGIDAYNAGQKLLGIILIFFSMAIIIQNKSMCEVPMYLYAMAKKS